jgi:hypothetical protein
VTAFIIFRTQADFEALFGQQIREALAPLDQHHGVTIEDFIEPEIGNLLRRVQAVEVDVVHPSSVFVD